MKSRLATTIMLGISLLLGIGFQASAAGSGDSCGDDPCNMKVIYSGAKPTIVDFVNAVAGTLDEEEGDCSNWASGWKNYQRTKQQGKSTTYVVDRPNGYARIESKSDNGREVSYHEFCFWNCDDGKHKLFAKSDGLLVGGKATETECTGLTFYLYDTQTHMLTLLGTDSYVLGSRPTNSPSIAYSLPRTGKDLVYIDGSGKRGTLRWNGFGFGKNRVEY